MSDILEPAKLFFDACETGKGWAGGEEYCHPGATVSSQTGVLAEVDTLEGYVDWLKDVLTPIADVHYALNRPLSEDVSQIITEENVEALFDGIDFTRLNDSAGSAAALASEVWRMFLVMMIVALIAEAVLCLPARRTAESAASNTVADFSYTR